MIARDLLKYKIDNYDNHIAKINASDNHDDNVERLWERIKFSLLSFTPWFMSGHTK